MTELNLKPKIIQLNISSVKKIFADMELIDGEKGQLGTMTEISKPNLDNATQSYIYKLEHGNVNYILKITRPRNQFSHKSKMYDINSILGHVMTEYKIYSHVSILSLFNITPHIITAYDGVLIDISDDKFINPDRKKSILYDKIAEFEAEKIKETHLRKQALLNSTKTAAANASANEAAKEAANAFLEQNLGEYDPKLANNLFIMLNETGSSNESVFTLEQFLDKYIVKQEGVINDEIMKKIFTVVLPNIIFQVLYTLDCFSRMKLMHNDLKIGNLLILMNTQSNYLDNDVFTVSNYNKYTVSHNVNAHFFGDESFKEQYELRNHKFNTGDKVYVVPNLGITVKIFDFNRSILYDEGNRPKIYDEKYYSSIDKLNKASELDDIITFYNSLYAYICINKSIRDNQYLKVFEAYLKSVFEQIHGSDDNESRTVRKTSKRIKSFNPANTANTSATVANTSATVANTPATVANTPATVANTSATGYSMYNIVLHNDEYIYYLYYTDSNNIIHDFIEGNKSINHNIYYNSHLVPYYAIYLSDFTQHYYGSDIFPQDINTDFKIKLVSNPEDLELYVENNNYSTQPIINYWNGYINLVYQTFYKGIGRQISRVKTSKTKKGQRGFFTRTLRHRNNPTDNEIVRTDYEYLRKVRRYLSNNSYTFPNNIVKTKFKFLKITASLSANENAYLSSNSNELNEYNA